MFHIACHELTLCGGEEVTTPSANSLLLVVDRWGVDSCSVEVMCPTVCEERSWVDLMLFAADVVAIQGANRGDVGWKTAQLRCFSRDSLADVCLSEAENEGNIEGPAFKEDNPILPAALEKQQ
ncbi:hypothetical protein PR048_000851 [Dryococelus australis]|uniref:Uncharacterized protein n=1 Tax=Dryococelus australis TaxID=614101 RepID=A0ABQ9IFR5_9NEOP|nr:hypothetical protein PR048_000851 [Dryococelus australis]